MSEDRNYTHADVVIGIDVGGTRKGFHAVALRGLTFLEKIHSADAVAIAQWCCDLGAHVVAVDAPCRWRVEGCAVRSAESEMASEKIACYYAPTEARAQTHAFYSWMIAGAVLYQALLPQYPLFQGAAADRGVAIETFPHAVSCALAGCLLSAKHKRTVRPELLRHLGIDTAHFANIDEVDAALCAVSARSFARNAFKSYGDRVGGFIVVPKSLER
jgi:predicted nuclease with RNAse H fold